MIKKIYQKKSGLIAQPLLKKKSSSTPTRMLFISGQSAGRANYILYFIILLHFYMGHNLEAPPKSKQVCFGNLNIGVTITIVKAISDAIRARN